jgi:hypothetical protein
MAPKVCALCGATKAMLRRPKTGQQICKNCFFFVFETEVHNTITDAKLFKLGDRVAIGASGGKGQLLFMKGEGFVADLLASSRFDSLGLCYENAQRTIQLRPGVILVVNRRGHYRISG